MMNASALATRGDHGCGGGWVMRIGFLGLGLMGEGFTRRLVELGHAVAGFDPRVERRRAAAGWGVVAVDSPAAAAAGAGLVMTCVTTTDDLAPAGCGAVALGRESCRGQGGRSGSMSGCVELLK